MSWQLMAYVPTAVFIFAFGAIVGSFINVVIYRLPAGMSVITPPSRCPVCGARLRWWENIPIIGWLIVRAHCRYCGSRISVQYLLIELFVAVLFCGLYLAYFTVSPSATDVWSQWWGPVGGDWFYYMHLHRASPVFIAHLVLVAALVAMSVIDARLFVIPLEIPLVVTIVALGAWVIQPIIGSPPIVTNRAMWPVGATGWTWSMVAAGGVVGLAIAIVLLRRGVLRHSFQDYHEYVKDDSVLADYPHARREMFVEILFLLPCAVGMLLGYFIGARIGGAPPLWVQSLGGGVMGYLVGGGIVWVIRILGSFAFGKEAMGLGDVHLLAAVGAVLGVVDPILVFVIAPFSGLTWVIVSIGIAAMFKRGRRELPFGPHLALATLIVILCRPGINRALPTFWPPPLPQPRHGTVPPSTPPTSGQSGGSNQGAPAPTPGP